MMKNLQTTMHVHYLEFGSKFCHGLSSGKIGRIWCVCLLPSVAFYCFLLLSVAFCCLLLLSIA